MSRNDGIVIVDGVEKMHGLPVCRGRGGNEDPHVHFDCDEDDMTTDHTNDKTPAPPARVYVVHYRRVNANENWAERYFDSAEAARDCVRRFGPDYETETDCEPIERAQPVELPALPDHWESEGQNSFGTTYARRMYSEPDGWIIVCCNGTVECEGETSPWDVHAVLSHHLSITAPVADVRALELLREASRMIADYEAGAQPLICEVLALLEGKGAPL